ncbi:hypothetical protein EV121DRAFT_211455 [Schizophyllum commune]
MSTESLPHQIDQTTPVSAFLGTGNEAHGGEVSAALQDWIQRAMDALAAVGPPPAGVVPNSVPTQTLPALGEVTLEVEPSNIDTNNPLANPRHRREIIRAAFDYVLAPPQTTSHSSEDKLDRRADTPMDVPGDPSEDRPGCTSNVDAPAGPVAADSPHPEPFPYPPNASPHSSPTPAAGVVPTPPTSDAVVDVSMADRSQNAIGDEGQQAIQATMTSISDHHHRDAQVRHNGEADKANAIEVRTTDTLQQDASLSISQYAIEYARAERERQEMKRRITENRQRAWAKDATTSRRDATRARKGATTPRKDARAEEHKSRAPKTRRQASPPPALLNRLRDPPKNVCSYNSERDDRQLPSTPTHSPRDRSPTPSTPPPSEYAGLPLAQRLLPVPLVSRIGPHPGTPPSVASSAQANVEDETRGRRPARASRSIEPSSTLSRNGALPQALPSRKAERAPAAAASAHIASTGSRRVPSTGSRTVSSTGTRKADGAGNPEQRLESASQRPATLASSAPGSTSVKTAEGVIGIPKLVADEGRASGKAGPSDAMAVDDPAEPITQSIVPRTATTTVSPQIVTPPPTPPTPPTPLSKVDNRASPHSPGALPPPAESASSSSGVQVSRASSHHNSEAGDSGIQPQTSPKRSYEEIATELLASTIPLDRSHSTRAQELAPAQIQSTVTPASPGRRAAPAMPTSTAPNISPVLGSTGIKAAHSSHAPGLTSNARSSVTSDCSASQRVYSSELGEYIFSLPVDNSGPMDASIEHTMEVERGEGPDQLLKTGEQSCRPLKMDEDVDEPMKVDEDTDEPIQVEEDTDEPIQVEEEEYTASTKGEEEEPAMKTENEVTSKTEEVKDVLVPVRPAPRYEPRALVPKLRQHSAASPSIGPSHSSLGHITNSQSFWIEMPPRTLPQESYLPMSQDGCQPSRAQDERQPLIPPPEQALRRSTRSTSSVYRRPSAAHSDSPRASASAPAWTPSASAQSASCTQSSRAAVVQPSLAVAQSPFVAGQSSAASIQASSVPARVSSAAAGPSSKPMVLPATSAPISVTSLDRSYRIPAPSDDEEEGTPILKLRRMNDDHLDERPSKRLRWA